MYAEDDHALTRAVPMSLPKSNCLWTLLNFVAFLRSVNVMSMHWSSGMTVSFIESLFGSQLLPDLEVVVQNVAEPVNQ
jgi:hypothetical protein